eukprot:CAMPEP_0179378862 /NCGR_PEP_ID=MMETSP0797-20121207/89550_1 /TAXON_ID=47934 /ORGANISM="Dinophysis acuminata, Strain DAEP01" /LENGTH=232 /DNA_ID=CAMNT_0021094939 /DNA_START=162 /DNA_END=863 /DNA_ORIENTATION=+
MPHMAHECHASYGKRHRGTSMLEVDASNASVAHQGTTTHAGISARATLWVREPDTRPTLPRIRAATSAPVSAEIVLGTPALGKRAAAVGGDGDAIAHVDVGGQPPLRAHPAPGIGRQGDAHPSILCARELRDAPPDGLLRGRVAGERGWVGGTQGEAARDAGGADLVAAAASSAGAMLFSDGPADVPLHPVALDPEARGLILAHRSFTWPSAGPAAKPSTLLRPSWIEAPDA